MVQPVRLVLSFSALLSVASVATRAAAEPVPSSCRSGLVLGVLEQDAQDVVVAVCAAAKKKQTPGVVRVSVLGNGDQLRVGVARLVDTTKPEETVHAEAPNVAAAIRIAPALLDAFDNTSTPPPPVAPAPAPAPAPPPAPAIEEPHDDKADAKADTPDASALETRAGPPAPLLFGYGASAIAGGGAGFGGGASVGIDHKSAQGFIDYTKAGGDVDETFVTIGARIKLSKSDFKPVIGGGWSYIDYAARKDSVTTEGQGIGVFAELGAIYAMKNHQLMGVARWNLGLFGEQQYDSKQTTTTYYYGGRSSSELTSTYAFLAGYGYVFR